MIFLLNCLPNKYNSKTKANRKSDSKWLNSNESTTLRKVM